jgi:hypothetical protein
MDCICDLENNVMNMSCPAHAWYFKEMRELPKVCDNRLVDALYQKPNREKNVFVPNRKMRRHGKTSN